MENDGTPQPELTTEDITKLLSKAQTLLEEQALFGQYIYPLPRHGTSTKESNPLMQQHPDSTPPPTSAPVGEAETSTFTTDTTHTTTGAQPATLVENLFAPLTKDVPPPPRDAAPPQKQGLGDWQHCTSLPQLYDAIHTCMECPLGATRTNFVFGSGNPNADVMVIGEAPGADEDAQGLPFVGAAGQLLTKILAAIGFSREEVYIANILKCRPPGNRTPERSEADKCEPYLLKQIELIKPKFILAVGLTAANTLLKTTNKMGDIRGKTFDYHGVTMLVTYHPAALLRNPNWKTATWEDVKLLRRMYDTWKKEE